MSGSSWTEGTGTGAASALGIDIGGGRVKWVVVERGAVASRSEIPRDRPIVDLLAEIVPQRAGHHAFDAIGVGLAGLVDHEAGRFVWGPHISDVGVDVSAILQEFADCHVVDNDANCAAFGEWVAGPAAGHRTSITVSVGTGIGAGLIIDGGVWRGSGFAGEVGHMTLSRSGPTCRCGRSGCWETFVSGRQLGIEAARLGFEGTAEALWRAALDGSRPAIEALRTAGRWLGTGIVNLILMLDPGIVVVAGGVSAAGDLILEAARQRIASDMPGSSHRPAVRVVRAEHGRWAAAVGAAHMAIQAKRARDAERFEETITSE